MTPEEWAKEPKEIGRRYYINSPSGYQMLEMEVVSYHKNAAVMKYIQKDNDPAWHPFRQGYFPCQMICKKNIDRKKSGIICLTSGKKYKNVVHAAASEHVESSLIYKALARKKKGKTKGKVFMYMLDYDNAKEAGEL